MPRTYKNRAYRIWHNLMSRANCPGYEGITICDEWKDFGTFEVWYNSNYIKGHDLDKDLKSPGNKHYSPGTCLFIPSTLNRRLAKLNCCGVYFHVTKGSWRAQGITASGRRGVIKQSRDREVCLQAYQEHLESRIDLLISEYPEYSNYLIKILEYVCA